MNFRKFHTHLVCILLTSILLIPEGRAGFKKKAEFPDRLALEKRIKSFDSEKVKLYEQENNQIHESISTSEGEEYFKLHDRLHSLECSLAREIKSLKLAAKYYNVPEFIEGETYKIKDQDALSSYNFLAFTVETTPKLDFVRSLLPKDVVSSGEWQGARNAVQKIEETREKKREKETIPGKFSKGSSFFDDLYEAVKRIDAIPLLKDGDMLVAIGNTPQFIAEAYRVHGKRKVTIIQVALSGWPGREKLGFTRWLDNILSQQGLEKYHQYMAEMGLSPKMSNPRVFFLDYIGGGGGPEFLMQEFIKLCEESQVPVPDLYVIATNTLKTPDKFVGREIDVDAFSLNMEILSKALDRVADSPYYGRSTISFPAWKWHLWAEDPKVVPIGGGAAEVIQTIKAYKPPKLYNQEVSSDNPPQDMSKQAWENRLDYYKHLSLEAKKFFDLNFNVTDLYGDANINRARELIKQISSQETKQLYEENLKELTGTNRNDWDVIGFLSHHLMGALK